MRFDLLFWMWVAIFVISAYVIEARLDEFGRGVL
jgi:hypothetical protein